MAGEIPEGKATLAKWGSIIYRALLEAGDVHKKTTFFSRFFLHISVVFGPYVEPNKRVVQYPLGNF